MCIAAARNIPFQLQINNISGLWNHDFDVLYIKSANSYIRICIVLDSFCSNAGYKQIPAYHSLYEKGGIYYKHSTEII